MSLLDFILRMLKDDDAREAFESDPQGQLAKAGLGDMCLRDVHDAMPLVADSVAPGHQAPTMVHPRPHESEVEVSIRQIKEITQVFNSYTHNEHHHNLVDNSVRQNIWADGDVNQRFDNDTTIVDGNGNAIGDGNKVVSGHHNAQGDGNLIGNGNAVGTGAVAQNGHGNSAATGAGSQVNNLHDVTTGAGGALAVGGGNASGSADDNSTNVDAWGFGQGSINVAGNGGTAQQAATNTDSHNQTRIDDHSVTGSFNDSHDNNSVNDSGNIDASVNDSGNTDVDASVNDSGNTSDSGNTDTRFNDSFNTETESNSLTSTRTETTVVDDHSVNGSFTTDDSFNAKSSFKAVGLDITL